MEIYDLDKYRRKKNGNKNTGILGKNNEPLLVSVKGVGGELKSYVEQIAGIAKDPYLQVFYELLQNANDSGATTLYCYFIESFLLVVNNGERFNTNYASSSDENEDDTTDALWSFLTKSKSTKVNDQLSVGEKGIGSKLIYTLLPKANNATKEFSKQIAEEVIDKNNGIILFSWGERQNYLDLLDFSDEGFFSIEDEDAPILAKIINTYFPSMPNEEDATNKSLFESEEINVLKKILKSVSYREYTNGSYIEESSLNRGSLLFLKIGEGVKEIIESKYPIIFDGLSLALNFFNRNVNRIVIDGKEIKKEILTVHSSEANVIDEGESIIYKFSIAYFEKTFLEYIKQKNDNKINDVNLYKFAPIHNEKHGLNFYVNAIFSVSDSRQNINWAPSDILRLEEVENGIYEYLDLLYTESFERFWNFYRVLILTNFNSNTEEHVYQFKQKIKNYLLNRIPTLSKNIQKIVFIKNSSIDIVLSALGIINYDWAYLGQTDYEIELIKNCYLTNFGFKNKNVTDIIADADEQKINAWFKILKNDEYSIFIKELNEHCRVALKPKLNTLKWIKGSDGNFYSLSDNLNTSFWVNDSRLSTISEILKNIGCVLSYTDFSPNIKLDTFIKEELDDNKLFKKVADTIDFSISPFNTKKLTPVNKNTLFHFFKKSYFNNVKIFQNSSGDYVALNDLIQTSVVDGLKKSLIPAKFRLASSDNHNDYEAFLTKKTEVFEKFIVKYWNEWTANLGALTVGLVEDFYNLVQDFYKAGRTNNFKSTNPICSFTINNKFEHYNDCIAVKYNVTLEKDVTNLLSKFGKTPIHIKLISKFQDDDFVFHNTLQLKDIILEKDFQNNKIILNSHEIEILFKLFVINEYERPFDHIYFEEENKLFIPYNKTKESPEQVLVSEPNLRNFIQKNNQILILLPTGLENIVVSNKIRINNDLHALREVIKEYGFEKDFAFAVYKIYNSDKTKYVTLLKDYIVKLTKRFDLVTDNQNAPFSNNSPEVIIAKLLDEYLRMFPDMKNHLKQKIFIDGTSLIELVISDSVELREQEYSLSILLNKYSINAGLIGKAKNILSAAGSLSNLLESEQLDADQVYSELLETIEDIECFEQFRFLINYQVENYNEDFDYSFIINYANSNKNSTLDILFKDDILFGKYFQFDDWVITESALVNSNNVNYLLPGEGIPKWVFKWIQNDPKKIEYLYRCGVKKDEILLDRLFFDKKSEKSSSEPKDIFWTKGDLKWCIKSQKSWKIIESAEEIELLKEKVKESLEKASKDCFGITYTSPDYIQVEVLQPSSKFSILNKNHFKNDTHGLKELSVISLLKIGFNLLFENQYPNITNKIEKEYNIKVIHYNLHNQIDKQSIETSSVEWEAPQYTNEWKNNKWGKGSIYYRIFISDTLIKYDFALEAAEQESITLKKVEVAKVVTEKTTIENDEAKFVYISKPALLEKENSVEKVLQVLEDYELDEFDKDALIELLINQNKIVNTSSDDERTDKVVITSTNNGKKIDNGFDVTPEEQELLELLKELGLDNENLLRDLLKNRNKKDRKELTPNKITGLKGEKIVYEFLKHFYEPQGFHIDWSALRGVAEYDFMIYKGESFEYPTEVRAYVDAKTTGLEGVDSDAIPFYVAQSQLKFLKELENEGKTNYFLARLNLKTAEKLGGFEVKVEYDESKVPNVIIDKNLTQEIFNELKRIIDFLNLSFYVLK